MPFPIIYKGKILFRNGRPATSIRCCCGPPECVKKCCCNEIIGYRITITGITDIPSVGCDCSALNLTIDIPKSFTTIDGAGNPLCGGEVELPGIECEFTSAEQSIGWTLACFPDGTHGVAAIAVGVTQGAADVIAIDQQIECIQKCSDLYAEQVCENCTPAPFPPQGNFCDYSGAKITMTPLFEE